MDFYIKKNGHVIMYDQNKILKGHGERELLEGRILEVTVNALPLRMRKFVWWQGETIWNKE